ncbi:hypothetical protein APHAL10511_005155 [Amanita phalloides]|nr:hypothetical protein APHAL10511_005155 [Amanita phalloides]
MFAKVLSLAVIASPFIVQAVAAEKCSRTYVVKEGDYCDSISNANHVSTYQLAVVNQGVIGPACDKLLPGWTLCLGHAGEDCTTTYAVADGDNCESIQAKAGINATLLHANNPQINEGCTNIYIGEVLCVAKSVIVPVAPGGGSSSVAVPPSTAIPANPSATAVHHHDVRPVHHHGHPPVHHHVHHHVHPPAHRHPSTPHPTTATPAPSQSPSDSKHDNSKHGDSKHDDDDLPYCDEL